MVTKNDPTNTDNQQLAAEFQEQASLDSCSPVTVHRPRTTISKKLRRPRRDEPFTTLAKPTIIACLVDRKRDSWGNTASEEYYPVIGELQSQVGSAIRSIAFHPCATASGETFICPQKLDPPNAWANSWNASLAQALDLPRGQWRTIWSDKSAECYKHELVDAPREGIPEYPECRKDLEQALTPNIISSLDHAVLQQLLDQADSTTDADADASNEEIY